MKHILKVGDKRNFSWTDGEYRIIEIIDGEGLTMYWNWGQPRCPNCKQIINTCPSCGRPTLNIKKHLLQRIELLLPANLKEEENWDKLIVLGFTKDGKTMRIPPEQTSEILARSKVLGRVIEDEYEFPDKHG